MAATFTDNAMVILLEEDYKDIRVLFDIDIFPSTGTCYSIDIKYVFQQI